MRRLSPSLKRKRKCNEKKKNEYRPKKKMQKQMSIEERRVFFDKMDRLIHALKNKRVGKKKKKPQKEMFQGLCFYLLKSRYYPKKEIQIHKRLIKERGGAVLDDMKRLEKILKYPYTYYFDKKCNIVILTRAEYRDSYRLIHEELGAERLSFFQTRAKIFLNAVFVSKCIMKKQLLHYGPFFLEKPVPIKKKKKKKAENEKIKEKNGGKKNQRIITALTKLRDFYDGFKDAEPWRGYSYAMAIRAIKAYDKKIRSFRQAKGIKGVGKSIAKTIEEIIKWGHSTKWKTFKKQKQWMDLAKTIYGVDVQTAKMWYEELGCRTIKDITTRVDTFTRAQRIGLKYYADFQKKIPRNNVKNIVAAIQKEIDLKIDICGSYRRNTTTHKYSDVDLLMYYDPLKTKRRERPPLKQIETTLLKSGVFVHVLYLGNNTMMGVTNTPIKRRIDIKVCSMAEYPFASLYWTGPPHVFRAYAFRARTLGFALNDKGFQTFKGVKLYKPNVRTEQDILNILRLPGEGVLAARAFF